MQVRVKGRRQGNVCGPDEVHLVTTARGEPLVGTLQGVDNQGTAPTNPNPSQRCSRVAPLPSRSGRRPPCGPSSYIIRGKEDTSKLIGYWPLTWSAGMVYIWGVGAAQGHGDVELIPCFCTILGDWCGGSAAYIVGTWGR